MVEAKGGGGSGGTGDQAFEDLIDGKLLNALLFYKTMWRYREHGGR